MALITADELMRGLSIGVFGGLAGACTLAFPGSPLWLAPAALAVGGCALTVPEVRAELQRALPAGTGQKILAAPRAVGQWVKTGEVPAALWQLPGVEAPREKRGVRSAARADASPLFETLEGSPHRLIIGHTRGGKTTLIHHMATEWARKGERVLVGDPDAAPGMWPGCVVRGHGDDVESIAELLEITRAEVAGRRERRAQGERQFPPLHLVIDEAHDVLPVLPGGLELFEDVARRGGKLNVRMTVGVQDKQVRTLGLERKSQLLINFQTADVLRNRRGERVAVIRDAETGEKISMVIPQLTDPESLIVRRRTEAPARVAYAAEGARAVVVTERVPERRAEPAADDLLAALLANDVPPHQDAEGTAVNPIPRNRINAEGTHSSAVVERDGQGNVYVDVTQVAATPARGGRAGRDAYTQALEALYRAAGARGDTFASTYAQHRGTKEIVFTAWQEGRKSAQGRAA